MVCPLRVDPSLVCLPSPDGKVTFQGLAPASVLLLPSSLYAAVITPILQKRRQACTASQAVWRDPELAAAPGLGPVPLAAS